MDRDVADMRALKGLAMGKCCRTRANRQVCRVIVLLLVSAALGLVSPCSAQAIAYVQLPPPPDFDKTRAQALTGDAIAQSTLGSLYRSGKHQDLKLAAYWYLKAAKQGDREAEEAVAEIYEFGEGVRPNHRKALKWTRKANAQYQASAMHIGSRYAYGINAPQDPRKAIEWYRISAEAGHVVAQTIVGDLYESCGGAQDLREAARWYRRAADQKWGQALLALGRLYVNGRGVPQDSSEAARLYSEDPDIFWTAYDLGLLYEQGLGVPQDRSKAMELYFDVASTNADARRRLFTLFEANRAVPVDPAEAMAWYREAANKGDTWAQLGLGLRYGFGEGVTNNWDVARALFNVAAQSGQQGLPNFIRPGVMPEKIRLLTRKMAEPGNLLEAIDYFIAHPPIEPLRSID